MRKPWTIVAAALVVAAVAAFAAVATNDSAAVDSSARPHAHTSQAASTTSGADLRVTLNRLFGEHALLAINATQRGLTGDKELGATAKALDRNSVELANAIGSVYGKAARDKFLNGKFMWRDHINFFVQYTVAKAKGNEAGQRKAVANLKGYIGAFSVFLADATGLPLAAVRTSITHHVMQLKGQLDAYAAGRYDASFRITRAAYKHMGMTGDVVSAAITKKFPDKFDS